MHRHKWSPWSAEYRPHIYEREDHRIEDSEMFNVRMCKDPSCNLRQEKKARI